MPHTTKTTTNTGLFPERACNRCTATNKDGSRCKKRTCIVGPECWVHTMYHYHVRVKPSTYGYGLFAHNPYKRKGDIVFKANQFICWYSKGNRIPIATITTKDVNIPYALGVGKGGDVYNPYKTNQFPGRYANDCNDVSKGLSNYINKKKGGCSNAQLKIGPNSGQYKKSAYIKATETIKQDEEILVVYGKEYWKKPKGEKKDSTGISKRTRVKPTRYKG